MQQLYPFALADFEMEPLSALGARSDRAVANQVDGKSEASTDHFLMYGYKVGAIVNG